MDRHFLRKIVAGGLLPALTACGGGSDVGPGTETPASSPASMPPAIWRIGIAPSRADVATSGSLQLTVEVLPVGAPGTVTWSVSGASCSGEACGTVDARGRYVAPDRVPGASPITVTARSTEPGMSASALITIVAQSAGTFDFTGSMTAARAGHTATLLADGRVLVAGGDGRSAELYDPASGTFSATGSMLAARAGHTATLLPNGRVLIAGPDAAAGVELYDPGTGTFLPAGALLTLQAIRTATALSDGRVLVAGETDAELYDPALDQFKRAGPYAVDAYHSTATLLADGRVLFLGGNPAQIYDPVRDGFSVAGSLDSVGIDWLEQHSATLLKDGRVLIAGGANDEYAGGRLNQGELYDPAAGTFGRTGQLLAARAVHEAVLLADGRVLVLGGDGVNCRFASLGISGLCEYGGSLTSAELYVPATGSFAAVGDMRVARSAPRATLLGNGDVLITGGVRYCGNNCFDASLASAELYRSR